MRNLDLLKKSEEAYRTIFSSIPLDFSGYEESLAEGGRDLYVDHIRQRINLHVSYGEWYYISYDNKVLRVHVQPRSNAGKFSQEMIEEHPEYHAPFLDLLTWAVAIMPAALERHQAFKQKSQDLLAELADAFPSYGLEGGISLGQALLDDDWLSHDQVKMQAAYAQDVTHDWRAIPEEDLESYFNGFCPFVYLDNKGWRYYLPAVLRVIVKNYRGSSCEFYTRITLLPGKSEGSLSEWNLEKTIECLKLTHAQGRVVAKILKFMQELDPDWFADNENKEALNQLQQWTEKFL